MNFMTVGQTMAASTPKTQTPSESANSVGTKENFLQLLVAQIKNQNPLQPTDSVQFVSQLAQFSQLEQSIAIRQDADAIRGQLMPTDPTQTQTQS